jgi:class 3 adenylate cyclase/tetratricopeptide (TPR) repeat protein
MERKLATILFVDLVDSTANVSAADPEVVRRRVTRYFEQAARCIEEHGGFVEKFAGDAVMAAFGVPRAHEDDAERAVRAAFAVMDSVHTLGLVGRAGSDSGEVVVPDGDATFPPGVADTRAARLQQAGEPGEIVLGPGTRRLAAGSVEVEDKGPLTIRGRGERVWAWRAVRVLDGRRRSADVPFVGREAELELLHNTFARTVRDRRAHLVTVFGDPGIGTTRLVAEFVEGIERATVLTGRALQYGEGVTYWPLAAMIKASAGIADDDPANEAFDKLRVCCESEAVADLLGVALGVLGAVEDGDHTSQELHWAALRWAEQLADAQPLVLVFEDVHWAEEPLLDLIEHLGRSADSVPLLVVTVTRADLLEIRPGWGGGSVRSSALELRALEEEESQELADALLATSDVPPAQRALVLEKAEGNPLFLEETARMLTDDEGSLERIPDTVQALISARIDALGPDEKKLLQRASLAGRVFFRGALDRLAPDIDVAASLDRLLDREFVVPAERSTIKGDRAFQFKHVLIRDVAYGGLSKSERAEEHRIFADWIAERAPEYVEIRAHHLDQASALLTELDGAVPDELAREAAAALENAGERALNRDALTTARRLLLRAVELEPTLNRAYLSARAGWRIGLRSAGDELENVRRQAQAEGDRAIEGRALLSLADFELYNNADVDRARELADAAVIVIEPGDTPGRRMALRILGWIAWFVGDLATVETRNLERLELARAEGKQEVVAEALRDIARARSERGRSEEALELLAEARAVAEQTSSIDTLGRVLEAQGSVELDHGSLEKAEAAYVEARRLFADIGADIRVGWIDTMLADARFRAGDLDGAERAARDALRLLTPLQSRGSLVEAQRHLAEIMLARGRLPEAERYALAAQETVGAGDMWSRAQALSALAAVRAAQNRPEEAESRLREAIALADATDYTVLQQQLRTRLESFTRTAV